MHWLPKSLFQVPSQKVFANIKHVTTFCVAPLAAVLNGPYLAPLESDCEQETAIAAKHIAAKHVDLVTYVLTRAAIASAALQVTTDRYSRYHRSRR